MADATATPDAAATTSRSALLARFDGGTWTPDDAIVLWSFLASGAGAQSLAHLFDFLKNDFLKAAATVMAGNDATEREALRLIVAGDYHQASNRLDEVFFVAPKESRPVVLRRQAALLGPVIPSTATVALKAAADLAPGDRLSRWTLGLLLEQLGKLDEATGYLEQLLGLELVAERHSDGALTQIALARIAGKQGNTELHASRLREGAHLYRKAGEKAETDADKHLDRAAATPPSLDTAVKAYETAGNAFQSAADLYTRIGDDIGAASSLTDLAYTCSQRELHAETETHAQRALDLYAAAGDEEGSVWALYWLAGARARRDVDGAQALLRRGLAIATKHGLTNVEQTFREALSSGDKPGSTDRVAAPAQTAAPAPGQPPVNSREYFRDRIMTRTLTEEDAIAIWKRLSVVGDREAGDMKDGVPAFALDFYETRVDFVGVVITVVPQASDLELGAIAMLSSGEFDDAAEAYEQVVAETSDENKAYKLGHFGALFAPNRPKIARKAWERMLKLNPGFHDGRFALGRVFERLEDFGDAAAQYKAVLKKADDDPKVEAQALEKLAMLELRNEDFDDAADYALRALEIHRRLDDAVGVHRVLLLLSDVAEDDEDYDGAVEYIRQALEVAMASGNVAGAGKSLAALEWLDQEEGFGPTADAMLERSIDWFAQQKSIPNAADAAMLLGEIHRKRGQLEKADHFYERSRKVSQDNDHHTGTARAFGALGLLRMGEKDYDHADWYFKTASKLYEDAGEQAASTLVLENRGWNLFLSGNREEAGSQFRRALASYANLGMTKAAARLREGMTKAGIS